MTFAKSLLLCKVIFIGPDHLDMVVSGSHCFLSNTLRSRGEGHSTRVVLLVFTMYNLGWLTSGYTLPPVSKMDTILVPNRAVVGEYGITADGSWQRVSTFSCGDW